MLRSSMYRAQLPALALALAACSGPEPRVDDSETAEALATAQMTQGRAAAERTVLTAADVEAFVRGLRREAAAVRESRRLAEAATTPAERGRATQLGFEQATIPEGARAAGMDVERYAVVRETITTVLETLDFQGRIAGPMEIDTTAVGPEMRRRVARDPLSILPAASAEAIRAQLKALEQVWQEYAGLTAVNG